MQLRGLLYHFYWQIARAVQRNGPFPKVKLNQCKCQLQICLRRFMGTWRASRILCCLLPDERAVTKSRADWWGRVSHHYSWPPSRRRWRCILQVDVHIHLKSHQVLPHILLWYIHANIHRSDLRKSDKVLMTTTDRIQLHMLRCSDQVSLVI